MILRGTRLAAAALATAAFAPRLAAAGTLAEAEDGVSAAERRLSDVERLGRAPEETPGARALRKFEVGEAQYLLEDWMHAAVLLSDAVD
ncbi:MAG TPA: hypothetical protein VIV57_16065, partial [Anaeromyxobacter sp.]